MYATVNYINDFSKSEHCTLRSPEIFAPARMPVADGKNIENIPKNVPVSPRQLGTMFSMKIDPVSTGKG